MEYNVYCDESCHLLNDDSNVMVLGAIWCPAKEKDNLSKSIIEIKYRHGLPKNFEIKWNKLSNSKIDFYLELLDFFFESESVNFRGLIVPDKDKLEHEKFNQTHDDFYYKMYFDMLKLIFIPDNKFNIYIDIKDTKGQHKVNKLHDVLKNSHYDFSAKMIRKVQQIRSDEVELLPIADLLIGALGYYHRGLKTNKGKLKFLDVLKEKSNYTLEKNTLLKEKKFNLLIWKSKNDKQ